MKHLSEIREIVARYLSIRRSLDSLEQQTRALELQKNQIELQLAKVREDESLLIDRIKSETGEEPDFYKITQGLINEANTVHTGQS